MEKTSVISTEHLSKRFALGFFRKKVQAVKDVSFSVEKGEIFGLLGPNGAGKTTTLKILMGLVKPSSGEAKLFGRPPSERQPRQHLGYLPESPYFYDYLSGHEFLVLAGQLCGLSKKESKARANKLIDRVGLSHAATRSMRRYSKGMLQRVGIAQALINEPKLVVLDEPLTGLDPIGRKELRELIAELRSEGRTVLFSSHIMTDVELLADRVTIIAQGKTVATGKLEELVDSKVINIEVVLTKYSDALTKRLSADKIQNERVGDKLRLIIHDEEKLNPIIDLIRKEKGEILSITPRKESLEDVVVRSALAEKEAVDKDEQTKKEAEDHE